MQDSIWSQEIQYNSWTPTKSLSIPWLHILRGTNVLFNQINVQTKTSKWTAVFMLLTYKQVHTYMYVYINESPRVCTSSLALPREHLSQQMQEHLPQGHPTGMMPTSGGYHRHTQLCISTVSTRNVLIMTEYGPVKRRKVPWLSNEQNQLHGHSPLTLNVSGSSPCCWNCVPNIPAPLISTISLRGSVIGKSTG